MKTFDKQCAQGDVLFRRVEEIPPDAKQRKTTDGPLVVAHSETGHHHQFVGGRVQIFDTTNPLVCYLRLDMPDELVHMRPFDTHETIAFAPGLYEMRRQRERAHVPAGWRRVED